MEKITVREVRMALNDFPEDLEIELSDEASAAYEYLIEYAKRLHSKDSEAT